METSDPNQPTQRPSSDPLPAESCSQAGPDSGPPAPGSSPGAQRWDEGGLRVECTQCGRCGQSHGEYAHLYLTSSDVLALAAELGMTEFGFRAKHTEALDGWTVLKTEGESCTFLDAKGHCSVYEARPMQCRTWPFWRENLTPEAWTGPVQAICPGLNQGPLTSADEIDRIAESNEAWYASDGGQV